MFSQQEKKLSQFLVLSNIHNTMYSDNINYDNNEKFEKHNSIGSYPASRLVQYSFTENLNSNIFSCNNNNNITKLKEKYNDKKQIEVNINLNN